jgi:hypothetical protein
VAIELGFLCWLACFLRINEGDGRGLLAAGGQQAMYTDLIPVGGVLLRCYVMSAQIGTKGPLDALKVCRQR